MKNKPFLSKSKYIAGLQCPKLLWMYYHDQDKFPPTDPATQAIFDQGQEVTELSHKLFPGGIEIPGTTEFDEILKKSQSLLAEKKPLFEAAFGYKNTYARADILRPGNNGTWDLFEVKSSTSVKDVFYEDVAFQRYCYEGAGLKIGKTFLVHINNEYVRNGNIDPEALFIQEDITNEVLPLVRQVETKVGSMCTVLSQKDCPKIKIGVHCDVPYECPLKDLCWDFLPEENVFLFNRIRRVKAFELIGHGILGVQDVPEDQSLTPSQKIQWLCHKKKKVHVDPVAIKAFLADLKLPIYFLDFETVGNAVPFYDQSRPYQQVPFQFSLHVLRDWDKKPEHHAFLAQGRNDPRPELLSKLKALLGETGTILSYNMSFELGRLEESVEAYPEYRKWFKQIKSRFRDLIDPFRKFDYYDPKQMGRTSIKNVFPALTGGSYEGMEIADGGMASLEFARITFNPSVTDEEKKRVRTNLENYCQLDTKAMIEILTALRRPV